MSRREQKKATQKVKSLQEMVTYMKTIKSNYTSRAIIRFINSKIKTLSDPNLHVVEVTMTKDEFLLSEEYRRNRKSFLQWLDLPSKEKKVNIPNIKFKKL